MNQFTSPQSMTTDNSTSTGGMTDSCANIAKDTILKGEVSKCDCMEVHGVVEGKVHVGHVVIHQHGQIEGTLYASSAEIHGQFKGNISVKGLIKVSSTGSLNGNLVYGELAVEEGADLVADIRKIKNAA